MTICSGQKATFRSRLLVGLSQTISTSLQVGPEHVHCRVIEVFDLLSTCIEEIGEVIGALLDLFDCRCSALRLLGGMFGAHLALLEKKYYV